MIFLCIVDFVNFCRYLCHMKQEYINQIRTFNRFYTKVLGVLNKHYLDSEFGLPEIRVIQDVFLHPERNARDIAHELNMDKGLLSRILKKLETKGYVYRERTAQDNRMESVKLTKKGEKVYLILDAAANQSIKDIFSGLDEKRLQEVVQSMRTVLSIMANDY